MTSHAYFDILDRAQTGQKITSNEWDFEKVVLTTQKLVDKHNIRWQPDVLVTDDEGLVDAVFAAGFELAAEIGVFARSTGRIVQFERAELEAGLRRPQTLVMGQGADARTLYARRVMDNRPPMVWAGTPGSPIPEEVFLPTVKSWMAEPIVDLVTCGSLTHVDGREVRAGEATEITATRRELKLMRAGLEQVGRPGMGMLAAQSAITELGDLAVAHPDYLRPCDAHLVPMLNELKFDHRNSLRVVNSLDYGMRNASLVCVMVGGLAGDAPGAAVVNVASFILGNLTALADYQILHPIHLRHVATTTRGVLWVENTVQQAFARNAPCIIVSDVYPKSGALTKELLYETAANAIVISMGGGHLEGVGAADGNLPHSTGLEARLMGEVGHAVTRQRLTLKQANTLVLRLLAKYEHVFSNSAGNPGVPFEQAYDRNTLKPVPEWQRMYAEVKGELAELGLESLKRG